MKNTFKSSQIIGICAALSVLFISKPVYAYIDPATSSYLIQIVAGIVITCGAAVGIYWKKIKMFFNKKKIERIGNKLNKDAEKKDR